MFRLFAVFLLFFGLSLNCAANRKATICLQPVQSGRCFGYVTSYAYDPFERKCKEFIYGGCGGNENRFQLKSACEKHCRDV